MKDLECGGKALNKRQSVEQTVVAKVSKVVTLDVGKILIMMTGFGEKKNEIAARLLWLLYPLL